MSSETIQTLMQSHALRPLQTAQRLRLQRKLRLLEKELFLQEERRQRLQCRYTPNPMPLDQREFIEALRREAFAGHVELGVFFLNPIFRRLQPIVLREVMRWETDARVPQRTMRFGRRRFLE